MSEIVTAVYENGLLRPLTPLKLRERQTIRLQVLEEEPVDEVEEALRPLVAAGKLTLPSGRSNIRGGIGRISRGAW